MKVPAIRTLALTFLLCLLGSFFWTELFLSQRNILAFKDGWHLYSQNFLNPPIKAQPDFISRKLLSGNRLSSDFTSGVQRILSDQEINPVGWEVIFRVGDDGYFDIITGMTKDSFQGIRLSRNPVFPSMSYVSDHHEKYLSTKPLKLELPSGFGRLSAKYAQEVLHLTFNGETISLPANAEKGSAGIQIASQKTEIFHLKFEEKDREFQLNFFPPGNRVLPVFLIGLMVFLLLLPTGDHQRKLALGFLAAGFIFFLADFFVFSRMRKKPEVILKEFALLAKFSSPTLEEKLKVFQKRDSDFLPVLCQNTDCRPWRGETLPKTSVKRIVIFGGSQTQLCCVTREADSFTQLFHDALSKKNPGVETINISRHGSFRDRLKNVLGFLENSSPDYLILETMALEDDHKALEEFVKRWSKKTRIIILRSPQNIEKFGSFQLDNILMKIHEGLKLNTPENLRTSLWPVLANVGYFRKLRSESEFIFLDPNQVFLDKEVIHRGMLWWDNSHLTGFGQELLAGWLARELGSIDASSSDGHSSR